MMTTREVAEYLRIKERKVYELVRERRIPCTRVTGKWLFPRHLIDQWVIGSSLPPGLTIPLDRPAPKVVVGSHDPLLEWSLRQSASALAMLPGGSLDGLERLLAGAAFVCGLHVLDAETGRYNEDLVRETCAGLDMVLIEWAWREQGLVVAAGNPLGIGSLADLVPARARVATRQREAGSQLLLVHLLSEAGVRLGDLRLLDEPALSETDLGIMVSEGKADAGLAIAAVARQLRLDFVPLRRERYDLLIRRRDYFDGPMQALLDFASTDAFAVRAREMGGYDVSALGRVVFNP